MLSSIASHEFFTLAEVHAYLFENCLALLRSASLFADRRIRFKQWHQAVPEPEEIVQIVFEKYWTGSRRMRKSILPRTQMFLTISSVLSNLATDSRNRRMVSLMTPGSRAEVGTDCESLDFEDVQMRSPENEAADREEGERLLGLVGRNELDKRVLEFILGRAESTSHDFMIAVRPRTIAHELQVSSREVYRSFERMRKAFESLRPDLPTCQARVGRRQKAKNVHEPGEGRGYAAQQSPFPCRSLRLDAAKNGHAVKPRRDSYQTHR